MDALDAAGLLDDVPNAGPSRPLAGPSASRAPLEHEGARDADYERRRKEAKAEIREMMVDMDVSLANASASLAATSAKWRKVRGLMKTLQREI